jgi:hypothetical protein
VSEGLALQFVERIEDIPGKVGVTNQWNNPCASWKKDQSMVHPPEVDSGVEVRWRI